MEPLVEGGEAAVLPGGVGFPGQIVSADLRVPSAITANGLQGATGPAVDARFKAKNKGCPWYLPAAHHPGRHGQLHGRHREAALTGVASPTVQYSMAIEVTNTASSPCVLDGFGGQPFVSNRQPGR